MRLASCFGIAIVLCLGLSLGLSAVTRPGAHASMPLAGRAPYAFPPGSLQVYRMTAGQNVLQLINPRSLADLPGSVLQLGPQHAVKQTPAMVRNWPSRTSSQPGTGPSVPRT